MFFLKWKKENASTLRKVYAHSNVLVLENFITSLLQYQPFCHKLVSSSSFPSWNNEINYIFNLIQTKVTCYRRSDNITHLILLGQEFQYKGGQCGGGPYEDIYRLQGHHGCAGHIKEAGKRIHHRNQGIPEKQVESQVLQTFREKSI